MLLKKTWWSNFLDYLDSLTEVHLNIKNAGFLQSQKQGKHRQEEHDFWAPYTQISYYTVPSLTWTSSFSSKPYEFSPSSTTFPLQSQHFTMQKSLMSPLEFIVPSIFEHL